MSSRPKRKDEALEAIDFIVNVLKQHEKDLDRLIAQLGKVTSQITKKGELPTRIETMEERLTTLQTEINNLIQLLSATKEAPPSPTPAPTAAPTLTPTPQPQPTAQPTQQTYARGPPVIVRCKKWQDFKTLAQNAETVSFLHKETEKTFQADALKQNRVYTYNGETPKSGELLKIWLARELQITEEHVFEGVLAIG
ncbi:MAG: hypothetical protein GWN33_13355 [Gammaproteobacteria bacterium]|nr:hypothetical protein [Gammaproteobacteria bacterium]